MTVKILIKRKVSDNQMPAMTGLLNELRMLTTGQPGYVSGETLRRVDRPDETLVISTWQSAAHWRRWASSEDRKEIQKKIDEMLGSATEYEIYEN